MYCISLSTYICVYSVCKRYIKSIYMGPSVQIHTLFRISMIYLTLILSVQKKRFIL